MFLQDRAVVIGQHAIATPCEALQGGDQLVEAGVVIGVIQLQVGDHPQAGAELHQGPVGFIRLGHEQLPLAGVTIAAEAGDDASNHSGWVLIGLQQQGGDQGAGGGFAVAAGDCNGGLLLDQSRQEIGAMPDLQPLLSGPLQFRIALGDGCADHHHR